MNGSIRAALTAILTATVGCGGTIGGAGAELHAPETRDARVTLSPALNLSRLGASFEDAEIVLEEISIHEAYQELPPDMQERLRRRMEAGS